MAHFAQLDTDNKVINIIVVHNNELLDETGQEQEGLGINFCKALYGADTIWIQTSYNGNFRKNFAGIGYTYDPIFDHFYGPKTYDSWIFNSDTATWNPPIPNPSNSTQFYRWNEELLKWDLRLQYNEETGDWNPVVE